MKNIKINLKNKSILITGGTGSFGKKFTQILLEKYNVKKVIIFSRDEFKQSQMSSELIKYKERLRFFIGDVRDFQRIRLALDGVNIVIHSAALKQVPTAEYNPFEVIKTNIAGTQNVINAIIESKVEKAIDLSTDKAASPINAMGISKALMEKIAIATARTTNETIICLTRYGNVMASRGSVIPLFFNQIKHFSLS
jgi:UDP-glucose 4-epimerase